MKIRKLAKCIIESLNDDSENAEFDRYCVYPNLKNCHPIWVANGLWFICFYKYNKDFKVFNIREKYAIYKSFKRNIQKFKLVDRVGKEVEDAG